MPAMETMPAKIKRNNSIGQDRVKGLTYRKLAEKYNITKGTVSNILNREEIKDVVDQGLVEVIARVPKAIHTIDKVIDDCDNNASLAYKASEFIMKVATIAPSNVENQTINNIVNIQNNQTLNPSVSNAIGSMFKNEDEDILEAEVIDG